MPFPAHRHAEFRLTGRAFDPATGRAAFSYRLDEHELTEHVVLPPATVVPDAGALDLLLDVAHVVIGTSYFKVSAPPRLVIERPVSADVVELARRTYDEGLREFAFVNQLPLPLGTEVVATVAASLPTPAAGPTWLRPLAPIGGGKDSAAVLTLLPTATTVTISPTEAQRRLVGAAGLTLVEVSRTLDPRLAQLTEAGLNGHIPVTAINSALSLLVALVLGHDSVVMGNERSASEATRVVGGVEVNHQYSKSFAYEELLWRAVAPAGVGYFSLVRQLSELSIAGIVTANPVLLGSFLSCNRAFKRSRAADEPQTWCLQCAKCLFTYLCFAPFLSVEQAEATFGGNPFRHPEQAADVRDLWLADAKPFDCVGERAESALAMAWLGQASGWSDLPVVQELRADAQATATGLRSELDEVLRPSGPHLVPEALAERVRGAADAVQPRP